MQREELESHLERSALAMLSKDADLFERNNSERCLTARFAHFLQNELDKEPAEPCWSVDVEFCRQGAGRDPKLIDWLAECSNKMDKNGRIQVTPDLIVHYRGNIGRNLFLAEAKKTTNTELRDCDKRRVVAFRETYGYEHGAVLSFGTAEGIKPSVELTWLTREGTWEAPVHWSIATK